MTIDINDPVTIAAKADIFAVLDTSPNEVPALLAALKEGRIDGHFYDGACCCLVGSLAKASGRTLADIPYRADDMVLHGELARDADAPAERWFWKIRPGDLPEHSASAALTVAWVEEWMAKRAEETSK